MIKVIFEPEEYVMSYSANHKEKSRRRILDSAYKLFSAKGYENVSINEIMAAANMTRGAFYAHFKSKSTLYYESIICAVKNSKMARCIPDSLDCKSWIQDLLKKYLSRENVKESCYPLAFLATDIVVKVPEVRQAYTKTFKGLNDILSNYAQAFSRANHDTVLAACAMVVGGLAIARALDDNELVSKLLESCQAKAMGLLNDT
jgi:TetR/AcrR family transcriptional repressor of nem operon